MGWVCTIFGRKSTKSDDNTNKIKALESEFYRMARDFENIKTRMLETDNRIEILRRDFSDVVNSAATSVRSLQNTINRLRRNHKEEDGEDINKRVIDYILPKRSGIIGMKRSE